MRVNIFRNRAVGGRPTNLTTGNTPPGQTKLLSVGTVDCSKLEVKFPKSDGIGAGMADPKSVTPSKRWKPRDA
eukprot:3939330-Rhodomonas_salina.2